jgi:hypothetical protein
MEKRECTCGGVDIGVGTMHEPSCRLSMSEEQWADYMREYREWCESQDNPPGEYR